MQGINEIHTVILHQYEKTKWPFFIVPKLKLQVKDNPVKQLNQLLEKGIIRKRRGLNATLVELIKNK